MNLTFLRTLEGLRFPAMEKESPCAGLSEKTLFAEEPWYAAQIKNGTLG